MKPQCMRLGLFLFLTLMLVAVPRSMLAADVAPVLTARETGVPLYARQDIETDRIATLEKGETLFPIAESVGSEIWYMVRTKQGTTGWVRGVDVIVSNATKDSFKEKESGVSTWNARTTDGRTFNGTWSIAPNSTNQTAGGAWMLSNANGTTVMRGTWSADKHSTGWNGVWRASVEGSEGEHNGSWSADFPHVHNARFGELFESAAKAAISGLWTGGSQSGSWSIRVVK
jgi:hypothetical protein